MTECPPVLLQSSLLDYVSSSQIALVAFVLLATTLMMISTQRRLRARQQSSKTRLRPTASHIRQERSLMTDVEQVMVQLDELARQINGQMDTRFAKLEKSIRDADARIDRLQRLVRAADGAGALDVTIGGEEADGTGGGAGRAEAAFAPVARGGLSASAPSASPASAVIMSEHTTAVLERAAAAATVADRRRAVCDLHDKGLSLVDIAQQTGHTTGEVELMLALSRTAAAGPQA